MLLSCVSRKSPATSHHLHISPSTRACSSQSSFKTRQQQALKLEAVLLKQPGPQLSPLPHTTTNKDRRLERVGLTCHHHAAHIRVGTTENTT